MNLKNVMVALAAAMLSVTVAPMATANHGTPALEACPAPIDGNIPAPVAPATSEDESFLLTNADPEDFFDLPAMADNDQVFIQSGASDSSIAVWRVVDATLSLCEKVKDYGTDTYTLDVDISHPTGDYIVGVKKDSGVNGDLSGTLRRQ